MPFLIILVKYFILIANGKQRSISHTYTNGTRRGANKIGWNMSLI